MHTTVCPLTGADTTGQTNLVAGGGGGDVVSLGVGLLGVGLLGVGSQVSCGEPTAFDTTVFSE